MARCAATPRVSKHSTRECQNAAKEPQTQSDPEGGIPSGSLEVLGRKLYQRALVSLSKEITQSSLGFLLLQPTTCWRTNVGPESRWARGLAFWADSEAKVQIAPRG